METPKEEYLAFPQARVQQIEERTRNKERYISPHSPEGMAAARAANMPPGQTPGRTLPTANAQPPVGLDMVTNFTMPQAASAPVNEQIPQTIQIQSPGFTVPTSEIEAVPIALPSQYAFYDFKDLYVRPFKGRNMAKLARAREEGSVLYTVEAVSSVLSTPQGHTHLGFKLTVPDFYYVLYWLRLNSFTKTAFQHTSVCSNEKHLERVDKGELLPDTLKQSITITKANLKETLLQSIPNPDAFKLSYPNVWVKACTMQDALEMTESADFVNEEFRYTAELACYVGMPDIQDVYAEGPNKGMGFTRPATLVERMQAVDDMCLDDHQIIKDYEKAITDYGIEETVTVTCRHCGHTRKDPITLDAHSFFPSAA